ncbi:MAG: MFS transporter [Chloroflexi bacterium]|nr:MAG: MFS transporter [Chloroflexota bacterium]
MASVGDTETRLKQESPVPAEPFQAAPVALISAAHLTHDTYTAFLPPLLPEFIDKLGLLNVQAGSLAVFLQLPSLLQPLIGQLSARWDLRYFAILGPAVTAIAMSLLGVAPNYAWLALLLVIAGSSSAAFHAVVPVLAGRFSGQYLGRGMSFWMVGGELGRVLGPLVVVSAVALWGLQGTPWLMLAGLVASALLWWQLRGVPVHATQAEPASSSWRDALRDMFPVLGPLIGLIMARSFMGAALTTYLPIFLRDEGAALWLAGASLSILEVAGVAGALLGGSLSDRLGRKQVLLMSFVVTPLLMFVFLKAPGWGRFPLLLALGFTSIAVTPVLMAFVQESFPEMRTLANGVYMALSFVIRAVVILAVGALGDVLGLRLTFTMCAGIALLGVPFILWLPVRRV